MKIRTIVGVLLIIGLLFGSTGVAVAQQEQNCWDDEFPPNWDDGEPPCDDLPTWEGGNMPPWYEPTNS